jgi:hypothetical protein
MEWMKKGFMTSGKGTTTVTRTTIRTTTTYFYNVFFNLCIGLKKVRT